MCSSEVERKRKILQVRDILICSCHLPPTVWQTQTMCSSEVERKRKILQVQDINMQLLLTSYSVADTDNV